MRKSAATPAPVQPANQTTNPSSGPNTAAKPAKPKSRYLWGRILFVLGGVPAIGLVLYIGYVESKSAGKIEDIQKPIARELVKMTRNADLNNPPSGIKIDKAEIEESVVRGWIMRSPTKRYIFSGDYAKKMGRSEVVIYEKFVLEAKAEYERDVSSVKNRASNLVEDFAPSLGEDTVRELLLAEANRKGPQKPEGVSKNSARPNQVAFNGSGRGQVAPSH